MKLKNKKKLIKQKSNVYKINDRIIKMKIVFIIIHSFCIFKGMQNNFFKSEITLVSTLFRIETPRHKFEDYLIWVNNLLQLNKPIIFFIDKNISEDIKKNRPKEFKNKTIWIELNLSDLFFYRRYRKKLEKTYLIDKAKSKHNVKLFIIWHEKIIFLRKSINKNYFKSNFFFWVDAGFFRDKNITGYINNWPCLKKNKNDPRVLLNEIRRIDKEEFNKLMRFDPQTHDEFMNAANIGAAFFGGRYDYLKRFFYFYFLTFKLFMKNKKFIGSEQNLLTIVGYLHPEITNIIHTGQYFIMKQYFLANNNNNSL